MLRLPPFRYRRAASVEEAAALLTGEGAAEGQTVRLVAGGTDLWPNMKRRHQRAATVVSLMGIPGLTGVTGEADGVGELRIGATTLLDDVVHNRLVAGRFPAVARAVASISIASSANCWARCPGPMPAGSMPWPSAWAATTPSRITTPRSSF